MQTDIRVTNTGKGIMSRQFKEQTRQTILKSTDDKFTNQARNKKDILDETLISVEYEAELDKSKLGKSTKKVGEILQSIQSKPVVPLQEQSQLKFSSPPNCGSSRVK